MSVYRNYDRMVKSVPIRTYMMGMESDTFRMQQAGWEFSVDEDVQYQALRMIARHRDARMYALSERVPFNYFAAFGDRDVMLRAMVVKFPYVSNRLTLTVPMETPTVSFQPIDAVPQMYEFGGRSIDIEDLGIFATPLTRTQEIFVPEETVSDLLDRILEFKQDVDPAYAQMKVEEGRLMDSQPKQKFHAQILSLAS